MTPRSSQCSEFFAKALTGTLVGDSEMSVKDAEGNLVPLYSYFCTMTVEEAAKEYDDLYYRFEKTPHERPREMVRRLGLDKAEPA